MPVPRCPTLALAALAAVAIVLSAPAQGVYYVDGLLGVDAGGYGSSASTPWKTIGHALANVSPPQAGTVVVRVRGDQTYSPGTNGESFPLMPMPAVCIEGTPGPQGGPPALHVPPGAVGIQFDPATSFASSTPRLCNLILAGGVKCISMGASPGQSHVVQVENCRFHSPAAAGIDVLCQGGQDVLEISRCGFVGGGTGVAARLTTIPSTLQLLMTDCALFDLAYGIQASTPPYVPSQCQLTTTLQRCNFEDCGVGIGLALSHTLGSSTTCRQTRVAGCGHGVHLDAISGWELHELVIDESTISDCDTGLLVSSPWFQGTVDLTVSNSALARCQTGVSMHMSSWASGSTHKLSLTHSTLLDNGVGVTLPGSFDLSRKQVSITHTRFLRGAVGLDANCNTMGSSLSVAGSLFAGQTADSMRFAGWDGGGSYTWSSNMHVAGCTFADSLRALTVSNTYWSSATNVVFSGNGTDVAAGASPYYLTNFACSGCLTDGGLLPGTNNQVLTDAQLLRPSYQLAPTSPCIDAVGIDIGAEEFVPTGSLRRYGTRGTSPLGATPRIGSPDTVAPAGSTFTVTLSQAIPADIPPPLVQAILALGFAESTPPLPFDLASAGIAGVLWVDPFIFQLPVSVSATGTAAIPQTIPDLPWLAGWPVFYQWLVVSAVDGMVTSDGLRVTFGS